MSETPVFRCEDVERLWTAYVDQSIADADADAVEAHAANCAACEARLTRLADRVVAGAQAFAPTVPPGLRDTTLRAISEAPRRAGIGRGWARIGMGVAAAAAVTLLVVRRTPEPEPESASRIAARAVAPMQHDNAEAFESAALRSAAQLADEQARSEFRALEDAMTELDRALLQAPDDAGLRAYVSAVRARRAELSRRVKDATS